MEPIEKGAAVDRSSSTAVNQPISRRRLLYLAGAGTAATVVAACSSSDSDASESGGTSDGGADSESGETSDSSVESDSGADSTEAPEADVAASDGNQTPDCVLTPEDAEGPFYADLDLDRQDITDGKPGAPLEMQLIVVDAATCEPIPGAVVDVWHADAIGLYSAFPQQGDDRDVDTSAESFLRGIRTADDEGVATFTSIYPGWYPGRTTHIHLKVHLEDQTRVTSQLYFPDDLTGTVYLDHPAYEERGEKDTSNDDDGLNGDDSALRMTVVPVDGGYLASHVIGINRS